MNRAYLGLILAAWLPLPLMAFEAIDYARYFPAALQGHHGNNQFCDPANNRQLTIYKGQVRGTNGAPLAFCSSNGPNASGDYGSMNMNACDDGKGGYSYCNITGHDLKGIDFSLPENQFKESSGTTGIDWGQCQSGQVLGSDGKNQFKQVIIDKPGCSLSFAPSQSEYRIKRLVLQPGVVVNLVPGDYWIDSLDVYSSAPIAPVVINVIGDGVVRIFINKSAEISAPIVVNPQAGARVVMVSYNSLTFHAGGTQFNGYIYSNKGLTINKNSTFTGRFTAGKLTINDASTMIDKEYTLPPLHIQFGRATGKTVVFERPFPQGVKPLVFLMPTISSVNTNQDGPASAFLENVSSTGFSWLQKQPAKSNSAAPMAEVDWIAVTPGIHTLPNGQKLHAGSVVTQKAVNLHSDPWVTQTLDPSLKVHIEQLQTQNNPCWFTSIGLPSYSPGKVTLLLSLEPSEVYSGATLGTRVCQAGNLNTLRPEVIGYLAVPEAAGVMPLNGVDVRYQFSNALTHIYYSDLEEQCSYYSKLQGFLQPPVVVASKDSRKGSDGGWLRRCKLTNTELHVVVDEDTYKDNERSHTDEFYDFIAFEYVKKAQIDHFEFDHSGQGLTCNSETVTLRACANASCSELFTGAVSVSLLPSNTQEGIWVGGNQLSFSGGQTQLQFRRNTPGLVTLGVGSATPSFVNKTLCRSGASALSEHNCSLNFADSGFVMDVPDKWANKPVEVLLKAVKKSDVTQQCVPSFQSTSKSVNFWSSYLSPSAPISPSAVTVNGQLIGRASAAPTPLNLQFDVNGQAKIVVNYPDAGKVQLEAKYIGSGDEQGLVMAGADQFVSVPVGLCVKAQDASASCPSADMSCNAYRKAGQTFAMTVQAMAWEQDGDSNFCAGNVPTPNFSDSAMKLVSKVVAPSIANGGNDGVLGVTFYPHLAQANNLNSISQQSISEVGVFQIAAQASPNYLGVGPSLNIPTGYSANIGRFVPDRFLVANVSVLPACGSFSYMDQPFPMAMTISALNSAGALTKNYFPPFSFASAKLVGENNNNGIDLQSRLSALPINAASWNQGVATVDAAYRANFSRIAPDAFTGLNMDGPFEQLDIGVLLQDNDPHPNGLSSKVAGADMNAAVLGSCTDCNAKKISTQVLRHGRATLQNTYGPESEILRMPAKAEYWNGSHWRINADDYCSSAVYTLGSQQDDSALGYRFDPSLTTGQRIARQGAGLNFQGGEFELLWQAVSSQAPYRGQVTAPLDVPAWLEWYWNWNGTGPTELADPRASAFFGRYRGHDKIIYWRETH